MNLERLQVPKYVVVRSILEVRWERDMRPGDLLPSEAMLCAEFSISRSTLQQVLRSLEAEGVIRRAQGRGTFYVGPRADRTEQGAGQVLDKALRNPEEVDVRIIHIGHQRAPARVQKQLALPSDTDIVCIERLALFKRTPIDYIYTYLPMEIGKRLEQSDQRLNKLGLAALLNDEYGVKVDHAHQIMSPRLADPRFAHHLGVEIGAPVLENERTYIGVDGKPLFCMVSYYRGDRHNFTMLIKDWR